MNEYSVIFAVLEAHQGWIKSERPNGFILAARFDVQSKQKRK